MPGDDEEEFQTFHRVARGAMDNDDHTRAQAEHMFENYKKNPDFFFRSLVRCIVESPHQEVW